MKKNILAVMIMVLVATSAMADDKVVSADTLPQSSKSFITSNFGDATATYVEKDFDGYDVQLSNGMNIDFARNGEWESVESMQAPVPTSILPEPVVASVTKAYPQATIMKVEKERGNFEIKLNNMMEFVVNPTGKIIGQKMDD